MFDKQILIHKFLPEYNEYATTNKNVFVFNIFSGFIQVLRCLLNISCVSYRVCFNLALDGVGVASGRAGDVSSLSAVRQLTAMFRHSTFRRCGNSLRCGPRNSWRPFLPIKAEKHAQGKVARCPSVLGNFKTRSVKNYHLGRLLHNSN